MTIRLLDCPLCGYSAIEYERTNELDYPIEGIRCININCGCKVEHVRSYGSDAEPVSDKWNSRSMAH